ncbi:Holliday junction branch migration helicase [Betalipothrixvirus uzonense]|uniref:Putative Holliday junction branch migration helicase n=1 Tax=Betalipothrixvirus uzonense TaxID=512792 RepID=B2CRI7_9VIRU|nr:Holliday junction branch migration helicase [Acidianus filamentous virus 9]ACB37244.1 putative Holliday junction branch migration helicase [Acidianus filamentous virus 9]
MEVIITLNLNEFQKKALNEFIMTDKNLLISAPTGTGKSFLAMLMAMETKARVMYTVPLRALALQLNDDFHNKVAPLVNGYADSIALTSEVYEEDPENLSERVIFTTYEKADAVFRRHYGWADRIETLIIDEIHNIGDKERGRAIENLIAYAMNEGIRLVMMSATIPDINKIAEITDAEIIKTDERPIPLYKAIKIGNMLIFEDGDKIELKEDFIKKMVRKNKVVMIFTSTRKKAEELYLIYDKRFPGKVAFFHAGLSPDTKLRLLEETRQGKYNIIISTTALSQGVNFPFYAVVFDDLKLPIIDYGRFIGWKQITPIEFDQICGRAGRPGYDEEGLCVIEATDTKQAQRLMKTYFNSEYGEIVGHHQLEDFLLALISKYVYIKPGEIMEAIHHTISFKGMPEILVKQKIDLLHDARLIGQDSTGYFTTPYGRAVAESYFDVKDAIAYHDVLERDKVTEDEVVNAILNNENVLNASKGENVYTIFDSWIKGVDEKIILKTTRNMTFNDLNKLIQTLSWQTYGVYRITKALGRKELADKLRMLFLEIRYGVPAQALALVQLPGIGRKRAVELMRNGIHNKTELCSQKETAKKIIGEKMLKVICR